MIYIYRIISFQIIYTLSSLSEMYSVILVLYIISKFNYLPKKSTAVSVYKVNINLVMVVPKLFNKSSF